MMNEAERNAIEHLIKSCEVCPHNIAGYLRIAEGARQTVAAENSTRLREFCATLDIGHAMMLALQWCQRSEQLFAKLREVLPEIEAAQEWED